MAKRFIDSPGVNLNTLATLATLQEQNKQYSESRKDRILTDILGTVVKGGAQIYQNIQANKAAGVKERTEAVQRMKEKGYEWVGGTPIEVQIYGDSKRGVKPGIRWEEFEKAAEPTKLHVQNISRPDGTYSIQTNPLTGEVTSKVIQDVPGVPLSQNAYYMSLQDKRRQDEIRRAEKLHSDAVAAWRAKYMRNGRLRPNSPPMPNLSDYYKSFNLSVPAIPTSQVGSSPDNPE